MNSLSLSLFLVPSFLIEPRASSSLLNYTLAFHLFISLKTGYCYVAQASLELVTFLSLLGYGVVCGDRCEIFCSRVLKT